MMPNALSTERPTAGTRQLSSRIRVLHLITELVIGGAQDNTLLTVEGLDRNRYEVHAAGSPGGEWTERARIASDRLHLLPNLRREISPKQDLLVIRDITRLLRQEQFTIVHTHSSKAGIVGRIAAKLAGTPVIVHTVHGFPFNDQTYPRWMRTVYVWLERLGAQLSDQLIMVADLNRREAIKKRIAPTEKMQVIYSGIDLNRFHDLPSRETARQQLGIDSFGPIVGTVGRISACNAPLTFVAAAKLLLERFPTMEVIVVGDGDLRAQIQNAIGDERRIHLLGFRSDVPEVLAAMDLFLFPNLWGGLGRSVTEALAVGIPVVAFPVNGVPELIQDGVTGLHARIDDAHDLADKATTLILEPDLAQNLARQGRERVWRDFSADGMVRNIDALYQRLLQEKGISAS